MSVTIIIPWMGECPHRTAARDHIVERLTRTHPNWTVMLGELPTGSQWCKALAVDTALRRIDADILIIHDADVWTDGLNDAVAAIGPDARWAVPHLMLYRLKQGQLEETTERRRYDQAPYKGHAGGGIVVIDRATYQTCPLDPRFVGFGQEDDSWAIGLTTLAGPPWRGDADLWHFWHPPQPRMSRARGNRAGWALWQQYRRCSGDIEAMRLLVDAGRTHAQSLRA